MEASQVVNVSYKLAYAIIRNGELFHGSVLIKFGLNAKPMPGDYFFLEFKGEKVVSIVTNGEVCDVGSTFRGKRIMFDPKMLKIGINECLI
jgi:hypothetical protein